MAIKILLVAGHGAGDPGAVNKKYNVNEAAIVREQVKAVKARLETYKDVTVTIADTSKDAFAELQKGKAPFGTGYDYVLEFHLNAFNGSAKGTEIYVTTTEKYLTVEQKINANLAKYFDNRGVKRTNFSVIWWAKQKGMSSALVESFFIDNNADYEKYKNNKTAINNAIADGIASGFGLTKKSTSSGSTTTPKPSTNKTTINGKVYWTGGSKFKMLKADKMYDNKELSTKTGSVTAWYFEKGSVIFADAIVKDKNGLPRLVMYTGDKGQNPRYLTLRADTVERLS